MDNEYDAVIIGGGIAGGITGKLIAEQGFKVIIFEEHREVGKPLQCAGLVTSRIFEYIPKNGCILNKVQGAKIYSPTGKVLEIDAKKTKAFVIDRVRLDQSCMSMALRTGCELQLGAKALNAKHAGKKVNIKILHNNKALSVTSKLIIGADGVQSRVRHWFGLKGPKFLLSGFGAELTGVNIDPRFVEIYLGNQVAPNFFSWVIPKAEVAKNGMVPARVGLACTKTKYSAYHYYQNLFTHPILASKLKNAKPIQYIAGGIPIGIAPKTYADNMMLVGDAAGQVKPTSGGGVYTSIICAQHCAVTANQALAAKDYSAKFLKVYQKRWIEDIGKELKRGMRLHKVYMQLRDDQLEEGFRLLGDKKILKIISTKGDIDYPSKLVKILFKKLPQLLMFAKPYLKSFF